MTASDQTVLITKTGKHDIYIHSATVTESISSSPIKVRMPITKSKQGTKDAGIRYYDLKRFEHRFAITGFLEAQDYDGDGSVESAKQVKDYLYQHIFITSGDILLQWRSQKDSDYHSVDVTGAIRADNYIHCFLQSARFVDSGTRRGESDSAGDDSPLRYDVNLVLEGG